MAEFWKALFILSLIHATKLTKRWKTYDKLYEITGSYDVLFYNWNIYGMIRN